MACEFHQDFCTAAYNSERGTPFYQPLPSCTNDLITQLNAVQVTVEVYSVSGDGCADAILIALIPYARMEMKSGQDSIQHHNCNYR